jgi:large subunit ribosomal protein L4
MAETPPRVPPQRGRGGNKQSAGDAPILGAAKSKKVKLDDTAFGARFNGPLVHESVRAELNARRRGTASTKTRAQVRGGGAKPWRQKGTGRARAGSSRSPIWTGGGVTFGPQPRSYTFKVNRKERRAALRSALSVHAERGTIAILDPSPFGAPSTKQANELIVDWADGGSVLVVLSDEQVDVALSFRNLRRVSVLPADAVGVADLVGAASLLVTQDALDELTRRAKGEKPADDADAEEDAE